MSSEARHRALRRLARVKDPVVPRERYRQILDEENGRGRAAHWRLLRERTRADEATARCRAAACAQEDDADGALRFGALADAFACVLLDMERIEAAGPGATP